MLTEGDFCEAFSEVFKSEGLLQVKHFHLVDFSTENCHRCFPRDKEEGHLRAVSTEQYTKQTSLVQEVVSRLMLDNSVAQGEFVIN